VSVIPAELAHRIVAIAEDRESGASALLGRAIGVLADGLTAGVPIRPIARELCRAQPSMASMWNAALEAIAAEHSPARFDRFASRIARAAAAMSRFGAEHLAAPDESRPLRVVTISHSGSVAAVLEAVHHRRPLQVSCSEGRPALEGRRMATHLAERGIAVTFYSDAAVGHALEGADAVLVGADAISSDWFLNKCGTRMLASAASVRGVPVYVVASRDKFVVPQVASRLIIREGAAHEIWQAPPAGIAVRNPYFETTPLDLLTSVITDAGVIGAALIEEVCRSMHDAQTMAAADEI
jgi:translation initiation factor eIF-2B subunit delta